MSFEFLVILYTLTVVLLIVLICLGVKMIQTLYKVDRAVDEAHDKLNRLNTFFDLIDTTSDTIAKVNDYFIGTVSRFVGTLFHPIKKNRKKDE